MTDNRANGITYFKLVSEFEGDYTKNAGLLGEEIDGNFYFLRANDIDSIEVDDERNLILKRVDKNRKPLIVNIDTEIGQPTFALDKDKGTLVVTYPNGVVSGVTGFLVEGRNVRVATDATMSGDGTVYKPLGLSCVEKTGTFATVEKYVDITADGMMPSGQGIGYRIVTKETVNEFGRLYPFKAVEQIQAQLTEAHSQWRVPTKSDWDELLNAFECDEQYKNHSALTSDFLGNIAGRALKSAGDIWMPYPVSSTTEDPVYGEDVAKLKILPLGYAYEGGSIGGFRKRGEFWSNTDDNNEVYIKSFCYKSGKVYQGRKPKTAKFSIRLVKDYEFDNYQPVENILGLPYHTEFVHGPFSGSNYGKIWTSVNVYDSSSNLGGIISPEWSAATEYGYDASGNTTMFFINEWDGTAWHKRAMSDGDSVIIKNHEGASGTTLRYHEWRIIDGELKDTVTELDDAKILTLSANLITYVNQVSSNVVNYVNTQDEALLQKIEALSGSVIALNERITDLETHIDERIETIVALKIKAYLTGTENEIKLTEKNNRLEIGFSDNAVFGII